MKRAGGFLVSWAAERYGDLTAVELRTRRVTFAEMNARTDALATGCLRLGLRHGDRVVLVLENSIEFIETWLALAKAGLVMVPVNVRLAAAERTFIVRDSEAAAAVCEASAAAELMEARRDTPALRHVVSVGNGGTHAYEAILAAGAGGDPGVEVDMEDLESIRYTSGTTGRPKGAVYTQRQMLAQLTEILLNLEELPGPGDRMLHAAALGHGSGGYLLPFYVRGAANVVLPRFDPETVLDTIARGAVTHFYLVPTMLNALLDHPRLGAYDLRGLKRIFYGASPISERTLRGALQAFGPILRQQYGTSETWHPITVLPPESHVLDGSPAELRRLRSAGRPSLGTEVRIVDEDGREVRRGETGEITVRRQGMMLGYWRQPEATARSVRDGWFHTGDVGRMDEDGYVYIQDRKSDMIISGGFNVYPAEVEQALQCHPGVREAAVVGVPDPYWGECVKAYVVRASGVTDAELIEWCKTQVASYKKPRLFEFVADLPRNATGKVQRRMLKARHEERNH